MKWFLGDRTHCSCCRIYYVKQACHRGPATLFWVRWHCKVSAGTLCVADCTLRAVTFQLRKRETGRPETQGQFIFWLAALSLLLSLPVSLWTEQQLSMKRTESKQFVAQCGKTLNRLPHGVCLCVAVTTIRSNCSGARVESAPNQEGTSFAKTLTVWVCLSSLFVCAY